MASECLKMAALLCVMWVWRMVIGEVVSMRVGCVLFSTVRSFGERSG